MDAEVLPLLQVLPENDRRLLLSRCRRQHFAAREIVFHEADAGTDLYVVVSGRALVQATTPNGETSTLAVIGPGQTFGELGLLGRRQQRTASVIALDKVDVLVLGREDFLALRDRNPAIDRLLVEVLAAQVERLSRHLVEALFVSVDQRIIRRLIAVAGLYGGLSPGTVVPITQDDLAGLAGTTRPTVNLTLGQLQDTGAVRLGRGRIEILDPVRVRLAAHPAH